PFLNRRQKETLKAVEVSTPDVRQRRSAVVQPPAPPERTVALVSGQHLQLAAQRLERAQTLDRWRLTRSGHRRPRHPSVLERILFEVPVVEIRDARSKCEDSAD